ncbi:MAG: tetratricopeptide repeat protein [Xanthomonadales bacterium]|nr:tetratricopeptide repeat protein [Gammaproteobacteria bacterium]NNJ65180.1 tetratricopeptide repeat protein [Xanthomonadales bacterium]NNK32811.1 tetratricopeptide repeat protein [Xanthomonadales bacterium]
MNKILTWLLCLLLLPAAPAWSADDDEVDYLALAALMMRDGNLDRALVALDQVDPSDEEIDRVRYHTLRGMVHLRRDENELSRDALMRAVDAGEVDSVVHVYLAQVNFRLEDYRAALASLDRAGDAVARIPSVYHMRAQSHWLLDEPHRALATLDQASAIFPNDHSFLRRKVFYLIDLNLFKEAAELGRRYIERTEGQLEDYIALGNALRASGDLDEAAVFLETAQLRFPREVDVKKVLAHVYLDRNQLTAAADLIYQAALIDPTLLAEAAELYRRSGQAYRALSLNGQLADQPEKFRQRLALYLQLRYFEQAAAMETPLYRVGLLEEEDLRYAIAYALFKSGEFDRAEVHLAELTRPDLFRKAAELRRAIQDCEEDSWKCL